MKLEEYLETSNIKLGNKHKVNQNYRNQGYDFLRLIKDKGLKELILLSGSLLFSVVSFGFDYGKYESDTMIIIDNFFYDYEKDGELCTYFFTEAEVKLLCEHLEGNFGVNNGTIDTGIHKGAKVLFK